MLLRRLQQNGRCFRNFSAESALRPRVILGIESSCDETGIAIVGSDRRIYANQLASQLHVTNRFGGPMLTKAARMHSQFLPRLVDEAMKQANLTFDDIDGIAVTAGPGLLPCLTEGINFSSKLAQQHSKPLYAINHLEAHVMTALLCSDSFSSRQESTPSAALNSSANSGFAMPAFPTHSSIEFPFLGMVLSGGHTELWSCDALGKYTRLGQALDDAIGEACDKVARLLGIVPRASSITDESATLGYENLHESFGAALERVARDGNALAHKLPIPLIASGKVALPGSPPLPAREGCDFSFSGVKSEIRRLVLISSASDERVPQSDLRGSFASAPALPAAELTDQQRADLAASFFHTICKHLTQRVSIALKWAKLQNPDCKTLVCTKCEALADTDSLAIPGSVWWRRIESNYQE